MKSKIEELKEVIGKVTSYNASPTLRAKLLKVNKKTCIMEVAETQFPIFSDKTQYVGMKFKAPIEYTWNAYFF